jgi:O-antigen chain-terminating methyltransferase
MAKRDIDKLSVNEIVQKIKYRVEEKKNKVNISNIDNNHIIYQYSDFTKYHNEEFIINIYKLLLNQEAKEGDIKFYLQQLRSGEKSKSEIITLLRASKQGKKVNKTLLGFKKRYLMIKIFNIPIIGDIFKSIFTILMFSKFFKRLNQLEAQSYMEFQSLQNISNVNHHKTDRLTIDINHRINELNSDINKKTDKLTVDINNRINELNSDMNKKTDRLTIDINNRINELNSDMNKKIDRLTIDINNRINELNSNLNTKATKENFKLYLQTVDYAKEYMRLTQKNMQTLIDDVKKRVSHNQLLKDDELKKIVVEEKYKFDNFYIEFEDTFRGNREKIKNRVEKYLPYIKNLPFEHKSINILDIGCGRGEWLEVLTKNNYTCEGIDINRIMVEQSKKLGLNVKNIDVIEYLTSLKSQSISVITGFHIIEHLPFEILIRMYDEILRILKPNGMVIFETPNPENVFVGTSNFYTDPTHINPIPPITSKFILEQRGYINVEIKRVAYNKKIHYDDPNLNHLFASSTDYAVIGYKA